MVFRNRQMDMCRGPLLGKMVWFTLPLFFSSILQIAFHAVDMIVIGRCAPHESLAAVGSSGIINGFMINIFCGLSVGTNVVVARSCGAKDPKSIRRCVHTSIALALYGGAVLLVLGEIISAPMLRLLGTPENVMGEALTYLRICFLAVPFILFFNFGNAVLRATGDTLRPMFFLVAAGVVNITLNLFFVLGCGMYAGGVALATLIAHGVSASLILLTLTRSATAIRLIWRYVRIDWVQCREILWIGIPAGLQSSCYAISNLLIQSTVNSFGSLAIAGSTAAGTLEGFVAIGSGACHQAALAFTAQNFGGRQLARIRRSIFTAAGLSAVFAVAVGWSLYLGGHTLLRIFTTDESVIPWGVRRMAVMFTTYIFCGVMDSLSGSLRGLGYSMTSTASAVLGICGFRICWICWVFPLYPTFEMLFLSYPVSWSAVAVFDGLALAFIWKHRVLPMARSWSARASG